MRTSALPGLRLRDLTLPVPLDHADPARGSIEVFARVIAAEGGEDRPALLYLQGGPGFEAPRATLDPASPPWLERALRDFRVVMLDQRGTGRSTPVGPRTPLPGGGALGEASPADQAEYLSCLRADAIVEDAELVREALGLTTWTVLGQSFGGFCTLRYLSAHPGSLDRVLFTGGLPAVGRPIDDAYSLTWEEMIRASEEHYRRFPGNRDRMRELAALAGAGELRLPGDVPISAARLRGVGILLGASGGAERLHHLLELDHRSPAFAHDLAAALPFSGRNPLYAVVHESCWADGGTTRWAAERTMPDRVREDPTLLAGEHVSRAALAEDPELAPWLPAAELLAEREWPALYDADALRATEVPGGAAIYHDDVFVPRELSRETAALLPGVRPWITSEYAHNGLRADGERVLDRLLGLADGRLVR